MTDLKERANALHDDLIWGRGCPVDREDVAELIRDQRAEIERLRKRENEAINALFKVCQNDWGIGHRIAKPAHDALKSLAATENRND